VTSDGNRALARQNVNARMENGKTRRHISRTSHGLKVTVIPGKTRAECLECDFRIEPGPKFQLVLFDAESHGRICELDCDQDDLRRVFSIIESIRNGNVHRDDL
jgi:hypothetical protein